MISATLVGARVEIDVFEDGHIEYSVFHGDESVISDIEELENIINIDNCKD
jgi:hypothetical protein